MPRDFDHGPNGGRTDVVDSGSWSLAGGWSRPFEPGPLLWPLARVGVASVLAWLGPREGSCRHASRSSPWSSNKPVSIALARRSRHRRLLVDERAQARARIEDQHCR